jgi:alpha-mannosidase
MTRKVLHVIAQAHLDPVWLWPWRDGCAEALTTMQSALDRMVEVPALRFSHSAAGTYRWAQEMDARLFEQISARIREGRWEPVGGWIVEPDCNIPSTESFVRQSLYGKRYFAEQLGADVTVGYNIDSFGHSGGLPQILARAGYRYYVMMRPQEHEAKLPMLFWWEADDGSRVLTWRISPHYGQNARDTADQIEQAIRAAADRCFAPGIDHGAFFFGVGNHGGGPTRAHLQRLLELRGDATLPELRFSTLGQFFTEVERSPGFDATPVVRHELQHHARGCYSAMGEIKAMNRRAERSLVKAESIASLTAPATAMEARNALRDAWWKLLFNQFHDVLAGSSIRSAYVQARDQLGAACDTADAITVRSLQALARSVDTSAASGGVLVLMNHLPWQRPAIVHFDTFVSPTPGERTTHFRASDGELIPVQWTASEYHPTVRGWRRLTAVVDLPACGYRVFDLVSDPATRAAPPQPVTWSDRCTVEDGHLGLTSLRAEDGRELLAAPAGLVVVEDNSDTWAHGVDAFRTELGRPTFEGAEVIEDGEYVRVVRQRGCWRSSYIDLDIVTWRHKPTVELRLRANWLEPRQILKLEVPTALQEARSFAQVPGGVARRTPDGGEEPCQDWLAVEGEIAGVTHALGVLNDSTYSYDCLNGLVRVTWLRSAPYAEHDPTKLPDDFAGPYLDQGWQERRAWLIAGRGEHTTMNLPRRAEELQSPAEYVMDSAHAGDQPWERSFLEVGPDNIALLACKPSEDDADIVIRLQETHGRNTEASIVMDGSGRDWRIAIGAWEIRTFVVSPGTGALREVDLLERDV